MLISWMQKNASADGVAHVGRADHVDRAADAPALDGGQHRHAAPLERGEAVLQVLHHHPQVGALATGLGDAAVAEQRRLAGEHRQVHARPRSACRWTRARSPGPTPRRSISSTIRGSSVQNSGDHGVVARRAGSAGGGRRGPPWSTSKQVLPMVRLRSDRLVAAGKLRLDLCDEPRSPALTDPPARLPTDVAPTAYDLAHRARPRRRHVRRRGRGRPRRSPRPVDAIELQRRRPRPSTRVTARRAGRDLDAPTTSAERDRASRLHRAEPSAGTAPTRASTFAGVLNDQLVGFYRSTFTPTTASHVLGVTQFESTYARRAFPCWDEPEFKATLRRHARRRRRARSPISNAARCRARPLDDGRVAVDVPPTMPDVDLPRGLGHRPPRGHRARSTSTA